MLYPKHPSFLRQTALHPVSSIHQISWPMRCALLAVAVVLNLVGSHAAQVPSSTPDGGFFSVDGSISTLAERDGILYVGGNFNRVFLGATSNIASSLSRTNLAAYDLRNNRFTSFAPHPTITVSALLVEQGRLWVGGGFRNIAGVARPGLACFDPSTGNLLPFDAGLSNVTILTLHRLGTKIYAGGIFTNAGSLARTNVAAFDVTTAQVDPWNAGISAGNVNVVRSAGQELYVGGRFTTVQRRRQRGFAAYDLPTGTLNAWNPGFADVGVVETMAITGNTLCAAGSFNTTSDGRRSNLALFDLSTRELLKACPSVNGRPRSLLVRDGTLYVAGNFQVANETHARTNLVALDLASGRVLDWRPSVNGEASILLESQGRIMVGGYFDRLGEVSCGSYGAFSGFRPAMELGFSPASMHAYLGVGFDFSFNASTAGFAQVMVSHDLTTWTVHSVIPVSAGENYFIDTESTGLARQFYRIEVW